MKSRKYVLYMTTWKKIDQMEDPELGTQQALADYKRLGYSDNRINQRLKSIENRKEHAYFQNY